MTSDNRMSAREWRASIALASVFGLRLLGMFVILPVFAIYAETLPGGTSLTLVGIAIAPMALRKRLLQIPFGLVVRPFRPQARDLYWPRDVRDR
jgi:hypothetical protein